ncbi:5'-methylthioadenosine/S-adenosylhomocysteine nucleosidase [bacterium 210917-SL.2.15]|nr:5'-methylthioadenosine/S-adenosylhomocysteine nucleosidase [bacterium 210917-SL.2.15]
MQIGVLYAMKKEAEGLLRLRGTPEAEWIAGVPFFPLNGKTVVCVGGVGKVNAAMAVQLLIDRFGVERIVNAGCAGALCDLPAGALVLGTECVQHDVDTTLAGDAPGFVSTVERVTFPCAETLETMTLLMNMGFTLTPGGVATGDWFGRDYTRAQAIRETYGALVCDMEACAAAQVCLRNGIPFQTMKVVTDHLFAPAQEQEYQDNFPAAMERLDEMMDVYLDLMEE